MLLNYILITASIFIFLFGYFPVQKNVSSEIELPIKIGNTSLDYKALYTAQINKLIFIIIDAMRYDFVTMDNMPETFARKKCLMKIKTESPTVTLPRIKSLTTGAVAQFIDIVLNLGASTKCTDSFLHRAQKANKKMVFYGDDTWLKMYPGMFERFEGTTSFFVNDFTEVDDNVTRHLPEELGKNDWDMMFLHYLGLDHIGHTNGPFSKLIKPKLREMDSIIANILDSMKDSAENILLLITGDHGMKDSGGHGGSTYAETHVPLIVYSNGNNLVCTDPTFPITQTDIATTISILFGIEIPSISIGKIIPNLMHTKNLTNLLYMTYYNTDILKTKTHCCADSLTKARYLHEQFLISDNLTEGQLAFDNYYECLNKMNVYLTENSVNQNVYHLLFGILGTFNGLLNIIDFKSNKKSQILTMLILLLYICLIFYQFSNYSLIVVMFILIVYKLPVLIKYFLKDLEICITLPLIIHICLMQSSSFIEEEHQIFYYFFGTISIFIFIQFNSVGKQKILPLILNVILRICRTLNSTGDQWASYPDLSDWLILEENAKYLILLHIVSLIGIYLILQSENRSVSCKCLELIILFLILIYKFFYEHAYIAQLTIPLITIQSFLRREKRLIHFWILFVTLLLRSQNTILLVACIVCANILKKCVHRPNVLAIFYYWLGYTFFFCQGHSNSIASIDLAPGYTGLTSYVPPITFFQTLCHTYAFPTLVLLLLRENLSKTKVIPRVIIVYKLLTLLVIYSVVFIQRNHLFVWSVFAPKLLIEAAHTLFLLLLFTVFYFVE